MDVLRFQASILTGVETIVNGKEFYNLIEEYLKPLDSDKKNHG